MKKQYHILNGDSLKEQFPKSIAGELIVCRECFVDGNVNGNTLSDLYKTRTQFINENYRNLTEEQYYNYTVTEFEKMQNIPGDIDINLWFEDDLFCQVNFWFTINLLSKKELNNQIFYVKPLFSKRYNFGIHSNAELDSIFEKRTELTKIDTLSKLWIYYQKDDLDNLHKTSQELKNDYPYIHEAVEAHKQRLPKNGKLGKPTQSLIKIMDELNTTEFVPIFQEFCKREVVYGYGDAQVKRLLEEIIKNR